MTAIQRRQGKLKEKVEKADADELGRIQRMLSFEKELWTRGVDFVAGVDESGRGPLAGPVVAAAVVFPKDVVIPLVDDSKKLSAEIREYLFDIIVKEATTYGIGIADVADIDKVNIYQASFLAMERALVKLHMKPQHLLVDGRAYLNESIPYQALVDGDCRCFSIAAASILAKVTRDRIMQAYDSRYPQYGFASHKGYSTKFHLDAIEKHGYCAIHRKSFHPKRFFEDQQLNFNYEEKSH